MQNLSILHIEDNEDDTALVLLELEKSPFKIACHRVETKDQFAEALANKKWDIILADYTVPGFGAVPALLMMKKSGMDIPFIIVSGTINEEIAVSTLKAGADDYIMKDRLGRLIPAITNALRERNERENLRRMRNQLSTVVEMIPDLFFIKNKAGNYEMINTSFVEFLGRSKESIVGATSKDIFPPETAALLDKADSRVLTYKKPVRSENYFVMDGVEQWHDTVKVPLMDKTGFVTGLAGISRDITEKNARLSSLKKDIWNCRKSGARPSAFFLMR